MKSTKITFLLAALVVAAVVAAPAQTTVFVPGTASGHFGNPSDQVNPLVPALTVTGPGTITVTYVSGLVSWAGSSNTTGPNGTSCSWCPLEQWPLQEARGIGLTKTGRIAALMGAFVPADRVSRSGFTAIDGTKNATQGGIMPGELFFIGTGGTFNVTTAGTLFLGINDDVVGDNGEGFTVTVTGP